MASLHVSGDLKINMQMQENGAWLVSIFFSRDAVNDNAKNVVPPMNFRGTPRELDEGFFAALQTPLKQTASLFTNMADYAEALEKAQKESKMEKEKQEKEKKDRDERQKKFETQMKRVAELEAEKKFGEAIGAMPKAEQFPEHTEEIKKKMDFLRENHGQLSLL